MSDELIKVVNFDGFISHVSDSGEGSEVIIYVAHVVSDDSRMRMGGEIEQDLFVCENNVNNNDDFGTVFTIRVGQCVERVAAKDISGNERLTKVRLIDKGIDVEVEKNALFPSTSRAKINSDCMCPILVVDAGEEQKEVAAQISGRECRCINGNLVVIPSVGLCVKGRLLISYGNGGYAELKDISLVPTKEQEYSKFVMEDMPQLNVDISPLSEHAKPFRYCCDSIACHRNVFGNNGGKYQREEYSSVVNVYGNEAYTSANCCFTNRWNKNQFDENSTTIENSARLNSHNYDKSALHAMFDCDREEMNDICALVSRSDMPYKQHAFKEYVPHIYPRTVRIRFDKIDFSSVGTFWAFEPNIFTTVEKVLHEGRQRYSACPQFDVSLIHELTGMGCLVRASVDSGYRSLCRAEIIKFAYRKRRFIVYLVDYGFYNWVKWTDVFDISIINKRDKIMYLPVALLHCRLEGCTNGIGLQQLEKGGEYEITLKSRDLEGIFNVHIDRFDDNKATLENIRSSIMPFNPDRNNSFFAPWCSCSSLQYTNDVFAKFFQRNMEAMQRNSFLSTMMGNNILFNSWPSICGFGILFPMIMPLMMPGMPNFGNITNRDEENRMFAQMDRGDNARNGHPFSTSRNMRSSNRKGNGYTWDHEEGTYRAIGRNGKLNFNESFDERCDFQSQDSSSQAFNRSNGRRRERNAGSKSRRSGTCDPHMDDVGSDEVHEEFSFISSEFPNLSEYSTCLRENERDEAVVCLEGSDWDLPTVQNQHANRLTGFDKSTIGSESKLSH